MIGKYYEKPKIIFSYLISDNKSKTILPIVENVINLLLLYNFNKSNFKVLLKDEASYCLKLGKC